MALYVRLTRAGPDSQSICVNMETVRWIQPRSGLGSILCFSENENLEVQEDHEAIAHIVHAHRIPR